MDSNSVNNIHKDTELVVVKLGIKFRTFNSRLKPLLQIPICA